MFNVCIVHLHQHRLLSHSVGKSLKKSHFALLSGKRLIFQSYIMNIQMRHFGSFSNTVRLSVCFAYQITLSSAAILEAKFQCRQSFELQLNF